MIRLESLEGNCFYRYQKYTDLACKGILAPEKLPPSEKTAYLHGLRWHFQMIQWSLFDDFEIQPTEWGWKLENSVLSPVMTNQEIAPQSLIKAVRCKCKVLHISLIKLSMQEN